jgi:hypothetical protein
LFDIEAPVDRAFAQRIRDRAAFAAVIATAYGMTTNTSPFNVTRHPSISIPCGWIDGLPVGLMINWTLLQRTPALPGCGGGRATSRRRRRHRAGRARALAPVVMAR